MWSWRVSGCGWVWVGVGVFVWVCGCGWVGVGGWVWVGAKKNHNTFTVDSRQKTQPPTAHAYTQTNGAQVWNEHWVLWRTGRFNATLQLRCTSARSVVAYR